MEILVGCGVFLGFIGGIVTMRFKYKRFREMEKILKKAIESKLFNDKDLFALIKEQLKL